MLLAASPASSSHGEGDNLDFDENYPISSSSSEETPYDENEDEEAYVEYLLSVSADLL